MLNDIWRYGQLFDVYSSLESTRQRRYQTSDALWDEYKWDLTPEVYPVDLAQKCYDNKLNMIHRIHEYVKTLGN